MCLEGPWLFWKQPFQILWLKGCMTPAPGTRRLPDQLCPSKFCCLPDYN